MINLRQFKDKYCPRCHKECTTRQEVRECVKAYKDFVKNFNEDKSNNV